MSTKHVIILFVALNCVPLALCADPEITSIRFENCTSNLPCTQLTRWKETMPRSAPSNIRVVATVRNAASYSDEFFVLSTTQYVVTPLYAYSAADFEKLKTGNEVVWGDLTRDDDMNAHVVHQLHREMSRDVVLRTLSVRTLLRDSFSDPSNYMWPWLARVTAFLVDRSGNIISTRSAILELEPSPQRVGAASSK